MNAKSDGPRADASLPPDSDVLAKAKTIRDKYRSAIGNYTQIAVPPELVDGLIEEVERLRTALVGLMNECDPYTQSAERGALAQAFNAGRDALGHERTRND